MSRWAGLVPVVLCALGAAPAIAAGPPPETLTGPSQAEAYRFYSLAQQSLLGRDYAEALDFMERAASQDGSPELLLELAQLRYSVNDLERAADLAERVAAARPSLGAAQKLLGDIALGRARQGDQTESNVARAVERYRAALAADPDDEDSCEALAEIYYQTSRLDDAGALLRDFARAHHLEPTMALLLGKVDLRSGRYDEAEPILESLVERAPASVEAADALAALHEARKRYDKAIAVYTDLLKSAPPTAYLYDRIGSLHLQAGRPREAITAFERGQAIDPTDSAGLLALGQAQESAGDLERALATYDGLSGREPGNLEARFDRARVRQKQGETEDALAGYRAVIDLASGRGAVSEREAAILALAYSQIGLIDLDAKRYPAAAEAFEHVLDNSQDPGPDIFLLLSRAHLDEGKPDEAQKVVAEARRRFPQDLDLRVLEGEVLIARGQIAASRTFFKTVLDEQKQSADAYLRVSESLLRQKRYGDTETFLREAVRRHPKDDALLFARGAAVERLGKGSEAERLLLRAIQINPKNAMALNYLGYMLAERGVRLKESLAYVEQALKLEPNNPAYLDSLGWAQFKMSLFGPAEKTLRDAVRYDGADPTIREHLGDVLMATGRSEEALREWEAALARGPEEPKRLEEKLNKARAVLKEKR
jgi:tetratricopeptide (TPR) repeat protein